MVTWWWNFIADSRLQRAFFCQPAKNWPRLKICTFAVLCFIGFLSFFLLSKIPEDEVSLHVLRISLWIRCWPNTKNTEHTEIPNIDVLLGQRALALLADEGLVDVGDDSASSNGRLDQGVQLLVSSDRQLQMPRRDPLHLQVLGGVACQLKHLNCEVNAKYAKLKIQDFRYEVCNRK